MGWFQEKAYFMESKSFEDDPSVQVAIVLWERVFLLPMSLYDCSSLIIYSETLKWWWLNSRKWILIYPNLNVLKVLSHDMKFNTN